MLVEMIAKEMNCSPSDITITSTDDRDVDFTANGIHYYAKLDRRSNGNRIKSNSIRRNPA